MRKKTAILVITYLTAAVVGLGAFAWTSAVKARNLELYARANTQHAFDELVTSMSDLSTTLQKSVYVSDPALESALCTQVFAKALTAQMSLGILPYGSQELEQTASFVSRVGDYAQALSRSVGAGGGYSDDELKNLVSLSETAGVLAQNLSDMQSQIMEGSLTMKEVYNDQQKAEGGSDGAPAAAGSLKSIEEEFPELPTLIYDGPFSDNVSTGKAKFLKGMKEIDEAAARSAAAGFLSVSKNEISIDGECGGDIPCWRCSGNLGGGEYSIDVTKWGGVILSALCSRQPGEASYSVEEGLSMAKNFMTSSGLKNMKESYHIVQGGVLTVNYEYVQNDVICYPDLVKVGIALDNGTLMSYDAKGYVDCHEKRAIPAAAVSQADAVAMAGKYLTANSCDMAIIPSAGGEERLCYEVLCTAQDGTHCILYVNAQTGAEEKILLLLEDSNGSLTI